MERLYKTMLILLLSSCAFSYTGALFAEPAEIQEPHSWKLDLFYSVDCPYSQKVIRYLYSMGIAITLKDIQRDDSFAQELIGMTDKKRVPCLVINGTPLLESDSIIQWLDDNIAQPLAG